MQGQKAICIQFPLQLGFAMTIHKIQGGTIPLGKCIASDFKEIFGISQAYTVLSRVKELDQLFLLDDLCEDEIHISTKSLLALKELEERAINANYIGRRDDQVNVIMLNVQNLKHHIEDIKHHHALHDPNLLILSETLLSMNDTHDQNNQYELPNIKLTIVTQEMEKD